jgi:hypothetical protein
LSAASPAVVVNYRIWGVNMVTPAIPGDIVIVRDVATNEPSFSILDAITEKRLVGSLPSLEETLQRASQLRRSGAIWHKSVDARGRELGPPTRLPMRIGKSR